MALRAIVVEVAGHVIRIVRALIIVLVARPTVGGQIVELAAAVTFYTTYVDVSTG